MPDIIMCQNSTCPSRGTCYRYRAEPDMLRQAYFVGLVVNGDRCDMYSRVWDNSRRVLPVEEVDARYAAREKPA